MFVQMVLNIPFFRTPSPAPPEARSPDIRVQPPTPKPRTQTPKKRQQENEEQKEAKWSPRQLESGDKELKACIKVVSRYTG